MAKETDIKNIPQSFIIDQPENYGLGYGLSDEETLARWNSLDEKSRNKFIEASDPKFMKMKPLEVEGYAKDMLSDIPFEDITLGQYTLQSRSRIRDILDTKGGGIETGAKAAKAAKVAETEETAVVEEPKEAKVSIEKSDYWNELPDTFKGVNMIALKESISGEESRGNYSIVNSRGPDYTYAQGRYQFLPSFWIDNNHIAEGNPQRGIREFMEEEFDFKVEGELQYIGYKEKGKKPKFNEIYSKISKHFLENPKIQEAYMDDVLINYSKFIDGNPDYADAISELHPAASLALYHYNPQTLKQANNIVKGYESKKDFDENIKPINADIILKQLTVPGTNKKVHSYITAITDNYKKINNGDIVLTSEQTKHFVPESLDIHEETALSPEDKNILNIKNTGDKTKDTGDKIKDKGLRQLVKANKDLFTSPKYKKFEEENKKLNTYYKRINDSLKDENLTSYSHLKPIAKMLGWDKEEIDILVTDVDPTEKGLGAVERTFLSLARKVPIVKESPLVDTPAEEKMKKLRLQLKHKILESIASGTENITSELKKNIESAEKDLDKRKDLSDAEIYDRTLALNKFKAETNKKIKEYRLAILPYTVWKNSPKELKKLKKHIKGSSLGGALKEGKGRGIKGMLEKTAAGFFSPKLEEFDFEVKGYVGDSLLERTSAAWNDIEALSTESWKGFPQYIDEEIANNIKELNNSGATKNGIPTGNGKNTKKHGGTGNYDSSGTPSSDLSTLPTPTTPEKEEVSSSIQKVLNNIRKVPGTAEKQDTEAETDVSTDEIGNVDDMKKFMLNDAINLIQAGVGIAGAAREVPEYEMPREIMDRMYELKAKSEKPLSDLQKAKVETDIERERQTALKNLAGSGLSAGQLLGIYPDVADKTNQARLNAMIYEEKLGEQYGARYDRALEEYTRLDAVKQGQEREDVMRTKMAASEMARTGMEGIRQEALFEQYYGEESLHGEMKRLQLENIIEQQGTMEKAKGAKIAEAEKMENLQSYKDKMRVHLEELKEKDPTEHLNVMQMSPDEQQEYFINVNNK